MIGKHIIAVFALACCLTACASDNSNNSSSNDNQSSTENEASSSMIDEAMSLVPGASVHEEDGNEFELRTSEGTIVEIEFNRDGSLDEASGDHADSGDSFTPGNDGLTLAEAVDALKEADKNITGEWDYKESRTHGWIYEFEGKEDDNEMEYGVSAEDGKIVFDRRDS